MIKEREAMCAECVHSEHIHDEGDYHEVCEAGNCVLCFQTGKIDCDEFKRKEGI